MRFGRTAVVALTLGVLVGCGDEPLDPDSPLIAAQEEPGDTPAALVGGTLAEVDGCLVAGGSVLVWGVGTTWDADTDEVVTPSGDRYAIGDDVSGGGGQIGDVRGYFGDDVADRLERCGAGDVTYVTA